MVCTDHEDNAVVGIDAIVSNEDDAVVNSAEDDDGDDAVVSPDDGENGEDDAEVSAGTPQQECSGFWSRLSLCGICVLLVFVWVFLQVFLPQFPSTVQGRADLANWSVRVCVCVCPVRIHGLHHGHLTDQVNNQLKQ